MVKNKRAASLKALQAKDKIQSVYSAPSPSMPGGDLSIEDEAGIDAQLHFSELTDDLQKAGLSLTDFLKSQNISAGQGRAIKAPDGETYTVTNTYLSYDVLLSENCQIDPDNVRDESERTEDALYDIIDEIGQGLQVVPIQAYYNENGLIQIAEGSRRYAAAIFRKVGLHAEIFDRKPSVKTINWLIEVSDRKQKFSYFSNGELYLKIMKLHDWDQKTLSQKRGFSTQEISRCVSFCTLPEAILKLLPSKRLSQDVVDKLIPAVRQISKNGRIDEVIARISENKVTGGSDEEIAKEVAKQIILQARQKSPQQKPEPEELFKKGRAAVTYYPGQKGSQIKIKDISKEMEEEILQVIKAVMANYEG